MISIVLTILVVGVWWIAYERYRAQRLAAIADATVEGERKKKEAEESKDPFRVFSSTRHYVNIPDDPMPRLWAVVLSVVVGFFVFGMCVVGSLAATEVFRQDNVQVKSKEVVALAALQDSVQGAGEVSGSFFLGIGSVYGEYGPESAFSFYERDGDELFPNVVAQDGYNFLVVREGDYRPHFTVTAWTNKCHTPWWLNPIHELCSTGSYQREWTFFVPRGTVLSNYKLDAR